VHHPEDKPAFKPHSDVLSMLRKLLSGA